MNTTVHALKEHLEVLRRKFNDAIKNESTPIDRCKEITEACENELEKLGYTHDLLYLNEDVFELLFSTAEKRVEALDIYRIQQLKPINGNGN